MLNTRNRKRKRRHKIEQRKERNHIALPLLTQQTRQQTPRTGRQHLLRRRYLHLLFLDPTAARLGPRRRHESVRRAHIPAVGTVWIAVWCVVCKVVVVAAV
jgi:hypothetical protein